MGVVREMWVTDHGILNKDKRIDAFPAFWQIDSLFSRTF